MTFLKDIWATRTLPEAFYTPRLVDMRPIGGGSYENVVQYAAIPNSTDTYSVKRFEKSLSIHEGGGRPVTSVIDTGLNRREAEHIALGSLYAERKEVLHRHADYAEQKQLRVFFRRAAPDDARYRWLTIRKDAHAMANPPYPDPPRPAFDRLAFS